MFLKWAHNPLSGQPRILSLQRRWWCDGFSELSQMLEKNRRWGWVQYGNTSKTLLFSSLAQCVSWPIHWNWTCPMAAVLKSTYCLVRMRSTEYNCLHTHTQYSRTHRHIRTQTWVKTCTTVAVRIQRLWPLEFRPTGRATHSRSLQPLPGTVRARLDQWRALERH